MTARRRASAGTKGFGVLLAALGLAGLAAVGCAKKPDYGSVHGRVMFQGQPLTEGLVRFVEPEINVDQTARIQSDGTYVAKMSNATGLIVGDYQVAVIPPVIEGPGARSAGPTKPKNYPNIPAKYRDPKTSGLHVTIEEGENPPFDIDMKP